MARGWLFQITAILSTEQGIIATKICPHYALKTARSETLIKKGKNTATLRIEYAKFAQNIIRPSIRISIICW